MDDEDGTDGTSAYDPNTDPEILRLTDQINNTNPNIWGAGTQQPAAFSS